MSRSPRGADATRSRRRSASSSSAWTAFTGPTSRAGSPPTPTRRSRRWPRPASSTTPPARPRRPTSFPGMSGARNRRDATNHRRLLRRQRDRTLFSPRQRMHGEAPAPQGHLRRERRSRQHEALQRRDRPGEPAVPEGPAGSLHARLPARLREGEHRLRGDQARRRVHGVVRQAPGLRDLEWPVGRGGGRPLRARAGLEHRERAHRPGEWCVDLAATLAQCDGTTNSLPLAKISDYTTCLTAALAYMTT